MRLAALMPARNEEWVLGLSARAALLWCDELVVLNHASSDGTAAILQGLQAEFGRRLTVIDEADADWREMHHRQALLNAARNGQATHIALVDADEVLTANLTDDIREAIATIPQGSMLDLPGYNLRGGLGKYHANGIWGKRWFSFAFADQPGLAWQGDCFHHRAPIGATLRSFVPIGQGAGGVLHLWGANERRLRAKHALYKMVETIRWPHKSRAEIDRLYNLAFLPAAGPQFEQRWHFAEVPFEWWLPYQHLLPYLDLAATPWQEEECSRLHTLHGARRFEGLDLFGVCAWEKEKATV